MDLCRLLLDRLATPHTDNRFSPSYLVAEVRAEANCPPHRVYEALWGLVGEGLIYLDPAGQGSGTDNWQWRLSAAGIQVVSGGPWEPRDPEGYLRRLRRDIPNADASALFYVEEALRAFNARCFLASSVMLGVASERVFLLLARAFAESRPETTTELVRLLDNPGATYFRRFQEFRKRLEPLRSDLPPGLGDVLTLDAVGDLLRVTRNDAGHPTGRDVDEDTARTHLQIAAVYLRKMTELRDHLEAGRADLSSSA